MIHAEKMAIIQGIRQNPSGLPGAGNWAILDQLVHNELSSFTAEGANLRRALKINARTYLKELQVKLPSKYILL